MTNEEPKIEETRTREDIFEDLESCVTSLRYMVNSGFENKKTREMEKEACREKIKQLEQLLRELK